MPEYLAEVPDLAASNPVLTREIQEVRDNPAKKSPHSFDFMSFITDRSLSKTNAMATIQNTEIITPKIKLRLFKVVSFGG